MNATWHMRNVKYPAAKHAIDVLNNLPFPVLHVGGVALDPWWPRDSVHYFECLDVLIQHENLPDFHQGMRDAGYGLMQDYPGPENQAMPAPPVNPYSPASPAYAYSRRIQWPPELWVRFHTTWRHSPLLLVDLGPWFQGPQNLVQVLEGEYTCRILRPPAWAMLLWQAWLVTGYAADRSINREEVHNLYLIAKQLPPQDWLDVQNWARQYDGEYLGRIRRPPADGMIARYAHGNNSINQIERTYGALYALHYALEALRDYEEYGHVLPDWVREALANGLPDTTWDSPRKIWDYAGVDRGDIVAPGESRGRLGTARADFTIRAQIDLYGQDADLDWAGLVGRELVAQVVDEAPPYGPWAGCAEADLRAIFI